MSIPFLLVTHFVGVRLQTPLFDRYLSYAHVIDELLGQRTRGRHWLQYTLLRHCVDAWVHRPLLLAAARAFHFPAFKPFLFAAAILTPTLAILGLHAGGHAK